MGRDHDNDSFPKVLIDTEMDFASIILEEGIEQKSYVKDGIAFSENEEGQIIEIQILNLSALKPQNASLFQSDQGKNHHPAK